MRLRFVASCLLAAARLRAQAPIQPSDTAYAPATELPNGRQVLAVYLGAKWCTPCNRPEVKAAVARMKPLVASQAKQSGATFTAVVVAMDRNLDAALAFIRPLGAFDEYAVGGDFVSTAAQRFVWRNSAPEPSVPQVLVLERTLRAVPGQPITLGRDRVLRRVLGDSIPLWVRAGAPIR